LTNAVIRENNNYNEATKLLM